MAWSGGVVWGFTHILTVGVVSGGLVCWVWCGCVRIGSHGDGLAGFVRLVSLGWAVLCEDSLAQ